MYILYVDPYFLGDPLFATGLARDLCARLDDGGEGVVIVHGTGEEGERAIEALGGEPERDAGVLRLPDERSASAVERAGRDLNRRLVDELNDAGVSAFRVVASDRGLVGPDGTVGRVGWLADLVRQRAVPVVLALSAKEGEGVQDLDPAGLAARLAKKMESAPLLALATRDPGTEQVGLDDAERAVPDVEPLRRMGLEGTLPRLVLRAALRQPEVPQGTNVAVADS